MRTKVIIPAILLIVIISLGAVLAFAASSLKSESSSTESDTDHPRILTDITYANYTDLDDDGLADDVYAQVQLDPEGAQTYTFDYYITLTLPSGANYSYLFVITTNYDFIVLGNHFINHAIEHGMYKIDLLVVLHTGGEHVSKASYEFDPPGGSDGGKTTLNLVEEDVQ